MPPLQFGFSWPPGPNPKPPSLPGSKSQEGQGNHGVGVLAQCLDEITMHQRVSRPGVSAPGAKEPRRIVKETAWQIWGRILEIRPPEP
jgi:hypothetical protein